MTAGNCRSTRDARVSQPNRIAHPPAKLGHLSGLIAVHCDGGAVALDAFHHLLAGRQAAVEAAPAVRDGDVPALATLPRAAAAKREG